MKTIDCQTSRRGLPCLCLALALAVSTVRAVDLPTDIVVPLNDRSLTHLEATATGLATKEQGDRTLKKDFEACMQDKKITGTTLDESRPPWRRGIPA